MKPQNVLVIHNVHAGDASQPPSLLQGVLADAGLRARYVSAKEDWPGALDESVDVVVLIGGDGTVAHAVRLLGDQAIPVAVLPTGTANNLAKTMGIAGDARDVVAAWRDGLVVPLDIWRVSGPGQTQERFVEAIGGGIFASLMASDHELEAPTFILGGEFDRALHLLRAATRDEPARAWGVEVDGADHSGPLIGIEVMNGPLVGPNVPLAPEASHGDGRLDVVLIREQDRDGLLRRWASLPGAQSSAPGELLVVHGRDVRLRPPRGVALHIDGDSWSPSAHDGEAWYRIEPAGRVDILVGRSPEGSSEA